MATANNKGRLVNFVTGIQGVSTGGTAVINFPTNARYHRVNFQVTGIAYNIDGLMTIKAPASANLTGAVLTPVVTAGVLTGVTITNAGTGGTNGSYAAVITDNNGTGAAATITVSGNSITAVNVTNGGVVGPVDPSYALVANKISVNGIVLRDITPASAIAIAKANGVLPVKGQYTVYFTEPWRNHLQQRTALSWDLFGQSTFQMQIQISPNISSVGLNGVYEFDYQRNVAGVDAKGNPVYFLNPTSQHQFNITCAGGRNDINTIPFSYPISRIWISGATAGNITQVEVYQDNNKVVEATTAQLIQILADYGFAVETSEVFPTGTIAAPFDAALVFDITGNSQDALRVLNALNLRVYSNISQNITFIVESLPGAYAA
jgi:hypothetical protein